MSNRNGNISPINFIDRVIKLNEKGLPWKLSPYQRVCWTWLSDVILTVIYSIGKWCCRSERSQGRPLLPLVS